MSEEKKVLRMEQKKFDLLIESLAKLRDFLQSANETKEAIDQFLNECLQPDKPLDLTKIIWVPKEGPHGAYELAVAESNAEIGEFALLSERLKEHSGKMTLENCFFWLMDAGIGRKLKK